MLDVEPCRQIVSPHPLEFAGSPRIPGLTYRTYRGPEDLPLLYATQRADVEGAGGEYTASLEDFIHFYTHLEHCDLQRDCVIAEVEGEIAAFARWFWKYEAKERQVAYFPMVWVLPRWWRHGLGTALLRHAEEQLRCIASGHGFSDPRVFSVGVESNQAGRIAVLEAAGYTPVTHYNLMVRSLLENDLPEVPLPEGYEVRPATPDHYRPVFDADLRAFLDDHGYDPPNTEQRYLEWVEGRLFQPERWVVAWHNGQVAGQVLCFIDALENKKYRRQRGWTEDISVQAEHRGRGLARALLARAMRNLKEEGMHEAALRVYSENPFGAYSFYESMGYRVIHYGMVLRKPLETA